MPKSKHIPESPGKLVKHILLPNPWLPVPNRVGKECMITIPLTDHRIADAQRQDLTASEWSGPRPDESPRVRSMRNLFKQAVGKELWMEYPSHLLSLAEAHGRGKNTGLSFPGCELGVIVTMVDEKSSVLKGAGGTVTTLVWDCHVVPQNFPAPPPAHTLACLGLGSGKKSNLPVCVAQTLCRPVDVSPWQQRSNLDGGEGADQCQTS